MIASLLAVLLLLFAVPSYGQKVSISQEDLNICNPYRVGTTKTSATLAAAITSTATGTRPDCTGKKYLLIPPGTWVISSNLEIPQRMTLYPVAGAILQINSGVTFTFHNMRTDGDYPVFVNSGTIVASPSVKINPVWWTNGGDGISQSTPWTSGDNSGGFIEAFKALQWNGVIEPSKGWYAFSSATPAQPSHLTGNSVNGNWVVDLRGVSILVTGNRTVFKFNPNVNVSLSSTDIQNVHVLGGFFTTGSEASTQEGTAIDFSGLRNANWVGGRTQSIAIAVKGDVSDTLKIKDFFFRRPVNCVKFTDFWTSRVSQDLYIQEGSIVTNAMMQCIVGTRVANIHIQNVGVAGQSNHVDHRFLTLATGNATGASEGLYVNNLTTEQFDNGKILEITTFGTERFSNITIRDSILGSDLTDDPDDPLKDGRPIIHFSSVTGKIIFDGVQCTNARVTCIDIDTVRDGGVVEISATMPQLANNNGVLFNLGTAQENSRYKIHRLSTAQFYNGGIGAMVYPAARTTFDTDQSDTAAIASASTITVAPWDRFVDVSGTTAINRINPTWIGHEIFLRLTGDGLTVLDSSVNGETANILTEYSGSFTSRTPDESVLHLRFDGTNWLELGAKAPLLSGSVAAGATVAVDPRWNRLSITGSGNVDTITPTYSGHILVVRIVADAVIRDEQGNIVLNGNFTGTSSGKQFILLQTDGTNWYEIGARVSN